MEAIISLCAIIVVSLIALRLGTRTPATLSTGNWTSGRATMPPARPDRRDQRIQAWPNAGDRGGQGAVVDPWIAQILWNPIPSAGTYPLLEAIDRARDRGHVPFALDHDADYLESRAQAWADAHWNDMTWLTGHIRHDRLEAMCVELERERRARSVTVHTLTVPAIAGRPHSNTAWTSVTE